MSQSTVADHLACFEPSPEESAPTGSPPEARSFVKVAEAGLKTLKDIAADPEGYFSGENAERIRGKAEATWDDARVRLKEFQREADAYIRENPTKAVLGALGAGFVLGILLKR